MIFARADVSDFINDLLVSLAARSVPQREIRLVDGQEVRAESTDGLFEDDLDQCASDEAVAQTQDGRGEVGEGSEPYLSTEKDTERYQGCQDTG
jgi:hypothetical protein